MDSLVIPFTLPLAEDKEVFLLVGGPLNNTLIYLSIGCTNTLVLKIGKRIGYYKKAESSFTSSGKPNTPTHAKLFWIPSYVSRQKRTASKVKAS